MAIYTGGIYPLHTWITTNIRFLPDFTINTLDERPLGMLSPAASMASMFSTAVLVRLHKLQHGLQQNNGGQHNCCCQSKKTFSFKYFKRDIFLKPCWTKVLRWSLCWHTWVWEMTKKSLCISQSSGLPSFQLTFFCRANTTFLKTKRL